MKKIVVLFALFLILGANIYWDCIDSTGNLSELQLANIEALAHDEGVEIICGQKQGACWKTDPYSFYNCGEYTMVHPCNFTGSMSDHCYDPCKR